MTDFDDDFSADELAYLKSRGTDSEAVGRIYGSDDSGDHAGGRKPVDEQRETPAVSKAPDALKPGQDDDDGDDEGDEEEEAKDRDPKGRYVKHGAFHKERERRKSAERERDELRIVRAKFEERMAILNEYMNQPGAEARGDGADPEKAGKPAAKPSGKAVSALEEEDIDPLEDFSGAMDQIRRRQREFMTQVQEKDQKREQAGLEERRASAFKADLDAYKQKDPSLGDAYTHLVRAYSRELTAFGMDLGQQQQHIKGELRKLAIFAMENKKSPSQMIYDLAEAKGFVKPQVKTEDDTSYVPASDPVKNKISTIKNAKKSAPSLSNSGGGANKSLTFDAMLNMSDDDFYDRVHKLPVEQRRKLLGGG